MSLFKSVLMISIVSCLMISLATALVYNNPSLPGLISSNNPSMIAKIAGLIVGNLFVSGNTNINGNLVVSGNLSVKRPYGMFSSTQTQTIAQANTAYYMTFNNTEDSYQIFKSSDNKNFTFAQTGDYLIELSIIASSSVAAKRVNVWVRKNGVDIPRSNTPYDFKSQNAIAVISVPFILDMNTTDHFQVMYSADSTGVTLPYLAGQLNATDTPSAIMTISKISEIHQ